MTVVPLPKYLAISQVIEAQIRAGRWDDGRIPSARDIAGAHGTSVITASRALQVLRDKGLIQTVERSGSFLAEAAPTAPTGHRWGLCMRIAPGPWRSAARALTEAGFDTVAALVDGSVDPDLFDDLDVLSANGLKGRARQAIDDGLAGLFLLPARHCPRAARLDLELLKACRDVALPVVLVERNVRGNVQTLEHDLVATDDLDGGLRSTLHLLEQGRRRIAFVLGSPTSSHEARMAGYLAALWQYAVRSGEAAEPIVLEEPEGVPTKVSYQLLADRLLEHSADGVICHQDYTAVGLAMELLVRGVRVPQDLAITGFDDLPIGNSFALGVTTYAFPAESVAREAFRVMRRRIEEPSAPPIKVVVPGTLIVRESTTPLLR